MGLGRPCKNYSRASTYVCLATVRLRTFVPTLEPCSIGNGPKALIGTRYKSPRRRCEVKKSRALAPLALPHRLLATHSSPKWALPSPSAPGPNQDDDKRPLRDPEGPSRQAPRWEQGAGLLSHPRLAPPQGPDAGCGCWVGRRMCVPTPGVATMRTINPCVSGVGAVGASRRAHDPARRGCEGMAGQPPPLAGYYFDF